MKKLSEKQKRRNTRRARAALGHRVRRRKTRPVTSNVVEHLVLPEVFSLRENFENSISSINRLREVVLNERKRIFINFQGVKRIGISCAMAMAAEMYRCKYLRPGRGGKVLNGNYPSSRQVYNTLFDLDFFRLFGIGEPYVNPEEKDESGNYTLMMRGYSEIDPFQIMAFRDACVSAFGLLTDVAKRRMQGAISEALLNAFNHAFSAPADFDVHGRRAWLTGYVNPERQEMAVMIFDQGAGIPRTLSPNMVESVMASVNIGNFSSDSGKIAAATQLGRTATRQPGRGKGFKTMKAFVDACDDAELHVFSNRGRYSYVNGQDVEYDDFSSSIGGTLVILKAMHKRSDFHLGED